MTRTHTIRHTQSHAHTQSEDGPLLPWEQPAKSCEWDVFKWKSMCSLSPPHKSRFISDIPLVSPRPPFSPLSWCVWPWLVALQRQHSPEVFKKIIEPAAKPAEAGGCAETNKHWEKKRHLRKGVRWEEGWRWFNSNCHVPAWNGDRLILALIWIYKMILSHSGRELGVGTSARGGKSWDLRIWLRICDKT